MKKGWQENASLLMIPAVGGHASWETVSAELLTIGTSGVMASGEKTRTGWSKITEPGEMGCGEFTSPCQHARHTLHGGRDDITVALTIAKTTMLHRNLFSYIHVCVFPHGPPVCVSIHVSIWNGVCM